METREDILLYLLVLLILEADSKTSNYNRALIETVSPVPLPSQSLFSAWVLRGELVRNSARVDWETDGCPSVLGTFGLPQTCLKGKICLLFKNAHLIIENFPWNLRLFKPRGILETLSNIFRPIKWKWRPRKERWLVYTHNSSAASLGTNLRSFAFFFFF